MPRVQLPPLRALRFSALPQTAPEWLRSHYHYQYSDVLVHDKALRATTPTCGGWTEGAWRPLLHIWLHSPRLELPWDTFSTRSVGTCKE